MFGENTVEGELKFKEERLKGRTCLWFKKFCLTNSPVLIIYKVAADEYWRDHMVSGAV